MNKFKQSAFSRFFRFFPKLFTAGLMYSVPLAVFTGIFVLISYLTGFNNVIIWGLGLIPSFPFYAGLVMIIRKYAVEKQAPPLFKTFFTAVKDNLKRFLIHGAVLYMIIAFGMFAILYYYTLSQTDVVFGSVLTIYMIFIAILIVMMFYVPIMEITYELKLKDIYKNAFLLVFGKILRNLIALVFLAAVYGGCFYSVGLYKALCFKQNGTDESRFVDKPFKHNSFVGKALFAVVADLFYSLFKNLHKFAFFFLNHAIIYQNFGIL